MPVINAGLCFSVFELLRSANGISDVTQILRQVSKLMFFNVENPTGRYRRSDCWPRAAGAQVGSLKPIGVCRGRESRGILMEMTSIL